MDAPMPNRLRLSIFILTFTYSVAANAEDKVALNDELWELDLSELLNVEVSVASSFVESDVESGSTVSLIQKEQWEKYGAVNLAQVLGHLPGTLPLPNTWGGFVLLIRGYASRESGKGIATILDGVPLNAIQIGSAF